MCDVVEIQEMCTRCGRVTRHLTGFSVLGFPEVGCTVCTRTVDYRWTDADASNSH